MNERSNERALRTLYQRVMNGWNEEDAGKFASGFTDDATFVAFDGTTLHGRRHIAKFHEPLFKTHLKGMRLSGLVDEVRFLSPTVAVLHALGSTSLRGCDEPASHRDFVQTLAAVKREGQWEFSTFQNTRLRPSGPGMSSLARGLADLSWKLLAGRGPGVMNGQ